MNIQYKKLYKQPTAYIVAFGVALAAFALIAGLFFIRLPSASALSGQGTAAQPFLIANCTDLQALNDESSTNGKYYELTGAIDCTATSSWNEGLGFEPIKEFSGVLDGNGYTISNLTINWGDSSEIGLFGSLTGGMLVNTIIDNAAVTSYGTAGVVAGITEDATIINVHVTNSSVSSLEGYTGGLIGETNESATIQRVSFMGSVTTTGTYNYTGGIIGSSDDSLTLSDVRVDADVTSAGAYTGGLIGRTRAGDTSISNIAVTGTVSGSSYVGGLFGRMSDGGLSVSRAFVDAEVSGTGNDIASIAATISSSDVSFNNVAYDATTSGTPYEFTGENVPNVSDITARNTNGEDASYFFNTSNQPMGSWDFSTVWSGTGSDYPTLRATPVSFALPGVPVDLAASFPQNDTMPFVSWDEPAGDGGLPLQSYIFQYRINGVGWAPVNLNTISRVDSDTLSYEFPTQRLGQDLEFRIASKTSYGISEWATVAFSTPDPSIHEVATCQELMAIDDDLAKRFDTILLTADIDCEGVSYLPIGHNNSAWSDQGFYGIFDGQGHTIANIDVYLLNGNGVAGLFSRTRESLLQNFTITNSSFEAEYASVGAVAGEGENTSMRNVHVKDSTLTSGGSEVAGLVGRFFGSTTSNPILFDKVSSTNNEISASSSVGGLFGLISMYDAKSISITNSYASGNTITGTVSGGAGGLVGAFGTYISEQKNSTEILFENVYSRNTIASIEAIGGIIGKYGLEGENDDFGSNITIRNAYAADAMTTTNNVDYGYTGGLLGEGNNMYEPSTVTIESSFAVPTMTTVAVDHMGGISGLDGGTDFVTMNNTHFYSSNGFLCANNAARAGCSSVANAAVFMGNTSQAPLSSWDFEDDWQAVDGDYPVLAGSAVIVTPPQDSDDDGITDAQEDNAPNDGDANNDGTADKAQANVTATLNTVSGAYTVLEISDTCSLESVTTQSAASNSVRDSAYQYTHGLVAFEASCGTPGFTANVAVYQYGSVSDSAVVRKYNPNTNAYFLIQDATIERTSIGGQAATIARYAVTDGGQLDIDGQANGVIVDPVGFATLTVGAPNTGLGGNARR